MNTQTIVNFATGIGNYVLMTPALRALASMDPSGQIDICTDVEFNDSRREGLVDLWSKTPFIQNHYARSDTFAKRYKTWFWTYWTTHGDSRNLFEGMHQYKWKPWDHSKEHESDFYMRIVTEHYGYTGYKVPQSVPVADNPILPVLADRPRICLCNGGFGDLAKFKRWKNFAKLSAELRNYFNAEIVGIGSGNELEGVTLDIDYVGKLPLTQTAKVLSQCSLLITTDTGNMHIADALGVPMIVLWGGSSLEKNKPYYAHNIVLNKKLPCQPCQQDNRYRECIGVDCLGKITTEEVVYYARNLLIKGSFDG